MVLLTELTDIQNVCWIKLSPDTSFVDYLEGEGSLDTHWQYT